MSSCSESFIISRSADNFMCVVVSRFLSYVVA